jgi:hypothetical protein
MVSYVPNNVIASFHEACSDNEKNLKEKDK